MPIKTGLVKTILIRSMPLLRHIPNQNIDAETFCILALLEYKPIQCVSEVPGVRE